MNKIHKLGRTRSNPFGMPLLAILIFLGTCQSMWAQVAATYTFASTSGTYVPITGGTVLVATTPAPTSTSAVDDTNYNVTLPFSFNFNGISYTSVTVNSNGSLHFGTFAANTGFSGPISGAPGATYVGVVSALGRDLQQRFAAPIGELRAETIGTAPNRIFVAQFADWAEYPTGPAQLDNYNFQIRLLENGNKAEIVYGTFTVGTVAGPGLGNPEVGLRGATNADFNNRAVAATGTWAASTAGTVNTAAAVLTSTIKPAIGQTYTWTPAPCSAVPATSAVLAPSLPIASSQFLACAGRPFTLSLSASNTGNTFQWESATYTPGTPPPATAYLPISGANGSTYTATQTVPTAYRCIISCGTATPVPTPTVASRVLVGISPNVECYCTATVVPNVACITNVTLGVGVGGLNNTTTCAPNVNHVATNTGVTNFPSNITTSLTQGSSPTITVSVAGAPASVGVWIDFNGNGIYDATTVPTVGAEYFPLVGGTATITVPTAGQVPFTGLTRMRVRSRIGALAATNSCTSFPTAASSGEIEDYYITINPAGCTIVVVSPLDGLRNLTKGVAMATITPIATGGAAGASYTYALSAGTLPVGVMFAGGVISGTPTVLENGFFIITATSTPGVCQGSMVYRFNVNNVCTAVTLSATPAAVVTPPAPVGNYSFIISKPVSIQLASIGGLATVSGYSYAITTGTLPSGLLLDTSTGIIAGTPNAVGSGNFSVTSTSIAENCSVTVPYTYSTVCPTVVISPAAGALTFQLNNAAPAILASGGANYTFALASGSLLPPTGLTLTPTGAFTGTPTVLGETGTFTVTVNTTTAALPTACTTVTAVYTYKVVCSDIKVSPVVPYIVFTKGFAIEDILLSASEVGSTPLYDFAVTGLPTGMTFVTIPATTTPVAPAIYKITGTPTVSGKGTFVVTATNPNAVALTCTGTSSFAYTVIDNPTTSLDALSSLVKVSPNPSKGEFNVDFSGIALGKATIRVYDAQGKQVYTSNVSNNQMTISLENLSNGIYLMEVDSAKGRILKRLAKQ